ncbi:MAG: 4Fe-4S dicluster domain-containing protein [Candidatus Hydrothermarchaeales archaeon]
MIIQDEEKEKQFLEELAEYGGEDLKDTVRACFQCGMCSGGCPTSYAMDHTPRQMVRMIQFGMKEEVLSSFMLWLCASCNTCITLCPRKVEILRLITTLKSMAIREGIEAQREGPAFYESFLAVLKKFGRLNELELTREIGSKFAIDVKSLLRYWSKTTLENGTLGFKLFIKGKLKIRPEKVRAIEHIRTIVEESLEGDE